MNGKFLRVFSFVLLIISSFTSLYIHSSNSTINQERLNAYAPLSVTKNGIRAFFSKTFNMSEFYQEIFPNDQSSVVQILKYVKNKPRPFEHAKHALRLFSSTLRKCPYINASAFSLFLEDVTPVCQTYVQGMADKNFDLWQQSIDKLLCNAFAQRFALFKEKPVAFLHEVSGSIVDSFYDQEQVLGDIPLEEFRTAITHFIELGSSKLVWHPDDGMQTWKLAKTIADQLTQLSEIGILSDDALQDLYDSLITRYCFFLDLVSTDLPIPFFEEIKKELSAQTIPLIDSGELENCIKTRRDYLISALLEAEAKSLADRITA